MDLTAFGLEPQDPAANAGDESEEDLEPEPQWPECVDCGHVGPEVKARRNQSVPLCRSCFTDREGL